MDRNVKLRRSVLCCDVYMNGALVERLGWLRGPYPPSLTHSEWFIHHGVVDRADAKWIFILDECSAVLAHH